MRFRSVRGRLALNAVVTGALLLLLGVSYFVASWRSGETLTQLVEVEVRPQHDLVAIDRQINAIHRRIYAVMLAQASPAGALAMLELQQAEIHRRWRDFNAAHRVFRGDTVEAGLIGEVDAGLLRLDRLIERLADAYRIHDPVQLSALLENDWYEVEIALLYPFRQLIERQDRHADASYEALRDESRIVSASLAAMLLLVFVFTVGAGLGLSRYVNRRIAAIERALDAVADGDEQVEMRIPRDETEMERIASAIGRTLNQLRDDREAIRSLMETNAAVFRAVPDGICSVDGEGRIMFVNDACCRLLGLADSDLIGRQTGETFRHGRPDGSTDAHEDCPIALAARRGEADSRADVSFVRADGSRFPVEYTVTPMHDDSGRPVASVLVFRDISERQAQENRLREAMQNLRETNERLQQMRGRLLQSEKLASIGQLAAGIAHEINNPVGFVNSNLGALKSYAETLLAALAAVDRATASGAALNTSEVAALRQVLADSELDYLREDLVALIGESREGLERVKKIILDLKSFARVDAGEWQPADLNAGLESTLNVVWNELKYKVTLEQDYGELPLVRCNLGKLNQVFMNLLVNAGQAIAERGTITVRTRADGDRVVVSIGDTGCGMAPEVVERIFDPFFTTKPVGSGTGLGLSLAWGIVRDHGGSIVVDSTPGVGSCFTVTLPVAGEPPAAAGV